MSTATLNGRTAAFVQSHRPASVTTPVAVTLTVSVELDRDDLAAALYLWDGMDPAEIEDDDYARTMIVESAVNFGLGELAVRRAEMLEPSTDPDRTWWVAFCHRRVAELFPAATPARRRRVRRSGTPVTARGLVTA